MIISLCCCGGGHLRHVFARLFRCGESAAQSFGSAAPAPYNVISAASANDLVALKSTMSVVQTADFPAVGPAPAYSLRYEANRVTTFDRFLGYATDTDTYSTQQASNLFAAISSSGVGVGASTNKAGIPDSVVPVGWTYSGTVFKTVSGGVGGVTETRSNRYTNGVQTVDVNTTATHTFENNNEPSAVIAKLNEMLAAITFEELEENFGDNNVNGVVTLDAVDGSAVKVKLATNDVRLVDLYPERYDFYEPLFYQPFFAEFVPFPSGLSVLYPVGGGRCLNHSDLDLATNANGLVTDADSRAFLCRDFIAGKAAVSEGFPGRVVARVYRSGANERVEPWQIGYVDNDKPFVFGGADVPDGYEFARMPITGLELSAAGLSDAFVIFNRDVPGAHEADALFEIKPDF